MMVRPSIRRALRILLPLLVLVGAFQLWDDYEVRQLRPLMDRIQRARRPMPAAVPAGTDDAGRFYAGAIAAVHYAGTTPWALRDAAAAEIVARNEDTLRLLDRGATLPLRSISGLASVSQLGRTIQAERAAAARTTHFVETGDTRGAVRSLVNQVLFLRAFGDGDFSLFVRTNALRRLTAELGVFLSRLTLAPADIAAIDDALAQVHEGDQLAHWLVDGAMYRLQFYQGGRPWRPSSFAISSPLRPFLLNASRTMLTTTAVALDAAADPWPDPVVEIAMHGDDKPLLSRVYPMLWTIAPTLQNLTQNYAEGLASVRACRVALAAYGSTTLDGAEAIDPFSGKPIIVTASGTDTLVYSVGVNRRDDGGSVVPSTARRGRTPNRQAFSLAAQDVTPDVGLRFSRASRP